MKSNINWACQSSKELMQEVCEVNQMKWEKYIEENVKKREKDGCSKEDGRGHDMFGNGWKTPMLSGAYKKLQRCRIL